MGVFMKNLVICDKCKNNFMLDTSKIRIKHLKNEVDQYYFICPNCKHKFIFMYKSKEIKQNLNKMNALKVIIAKRIKTKNDISKLIDNYNVLYKKNLELSKKYKNIYG